MYQWSLLAVGMEPSRPKPPNSSAKAGEPSVTAASSKRHWQIVSGLRNGYKLHRRNRVLQAVAAASDHLRQEDGLVEHCQPPPNTGTGAQSEGDVVVARLVLEFLALPAEPAVWQKEMRVREQLRRLLRLPNAVSHCPVFGNLESLKGKKESVYCHKHGNLRHQERGYNFRTIAKRETQSECKVKTSMSLKSEQSLTDCNIEILATRTELTGCNVEILATLTALSGCNVEILATLTALTGCNVGILVNPDDTDWV